MNKEKEVKDLNDLIFEIEIIIKNIDEQLTFSAKTNLIDLKNKLIERMIERI